MEANSADSTSAPTGITATTAPVTAAPAVKLDEEGKALELAAAKAAHRKTIAESGKAVVEAQRDALSAALPTVKTEALKGDITLGEGVGIISERLAFRLVSDAAGRVAAAVQMVLPDDSRVLLVDERDLVSSDWSYEFVRLQLDVYGDALAKAKDIVTAATPSTDGAPSATSAQELEAIAAAVRASQSRRGVSPALVAPGLTVAESLVGAAADVASFFRSDFSIASNEVAVGATPLTAAICERLSAETSIAVDRFMRLDGDGIVKRFEDALEARMELKRSTSLLKARVVELSTRGVEALRAELTAKSTAKNAEKDTAQRARLEEEELKLKRDISEAETKAGPAAAAVASAEALITGFDGLTEKVTSEPEAGGLPPLGIAAIRERLHTGDVPYTHVLFASVESSAGESIARKSIWPWWNTVTFLGGAQLSFLLAELAGNTVRAAGTESLLARMKLNLSTGSTSGPEPVEGQSTSNKSNRLSDAGEGATKAR